MANFFIKKLVAQAQKPQGFFGRLFAKGMNKGHDKMALWGLSNFSFKNGDRLLDVGCGGGQNILNLFRQYPDSAVDGIDYSPESVRVSRKMHAKRLGAKCRIDEGNVLSLPYADESYGGVTGFETIYFWDPLVDGLKEIYRVLKPGGRVLLVEESNDPERAKIWLEACEGMTVYTPEDQFAALKEAGFRNIEIKTQGDWVAASGIK